MPVMRPIETYASDPRASRVLPSFHSIIHNSRVTKHGEARLDRTCPQVRDVFASPSSMTDDRYFAGRMSSVERG